MFYKIELKDHIRVPPDLFGLPVAESIIKRVRKKYENYVSKDIGMVIDVLGIKDVGEGIVIPGDGASYYDTNFELLTFKPELQEVIYGEIKEIADFGAFMTIGPVDGMIHISQTMDDFVSFSKDKTLQGKESKKSLRIGDRCKARLVALSYKDISNPKLGLTMRQPGLGRLDWIEEESKPKEEKPKEKKGANKK